VNPETPPENWISYTDPDHDANVEWSELVWFGVIGFAVTIAAFVIWVVSNVFLSAVMIP
jgi:hypothetical protein